MSGRGWTEESVPAWLGDRFGLRKPALEQVSGGNSRRIWRASDAADPGRPRLLVRAQFQPGLSPVYTLAREAAVYEALNRIGARVPRVRGLSEDGAVLVMDLLPGDASLRGLDAGGQARVIREYLACLDAVHAADPRVLFPGGCLGGRTLPDTLAGYLDAELAIWERAMRDTPVGPGPLLELGLRWLRDTMPAPADRLSLVHGDAGPGNFLQRDGQVTGIIDWEFAHVGDPLEDLAWTLMRGTLDRVPQIASLVRAHCAAAGLDDGARLDYFLTLVLWKVMVIRHRMTGDLTRNVGRNLYYRLIHQRMFTQVMARNLGVPEPAADPPRDLPGTGREWLYDFAVGRVKDALPALADTGAQSALASVVRVLRYLRTWDNAGSWILGPDSGDDIKLADGVRSGHLSCADAFAGTAPRLAREFALCSEFLGPALDPLVPPV